MRLPVPAVENLDEVGECFDFATCRERVKESRESEETEEKTAQRFALDRYGGTLSRTLANFRPRETASRAA
jgi:hypothetical protein